MKSCITCGMRRGQICLRQGFTWESMRQVSRGDAYCDENFSGWVSENSDQPPRGICRLIARFFPKTYQRIAAIGWEQGRLDEQKRARKFRRDKEGRFAA